MTRAVVVLRPEPGNAATVARVVAAGHRAIALPMFATHAVAWRPPAGAFDALLLTSANAVRHAGTLPDLPVVAVGAATADAARAAGAQIALVGDADAAAAVERARACGYHALLHLAGRERVALPGVAAVTVYASEPCEVPPAALAAVHGGIALLHSARAAMRFATLIDRAGPPRGAVRIACLARAVAEAAGTGWGGVAIAPHPADAALIATLATLAD